MSAKQLCSRCHTVFIVTASGSSTKRPHTLASTNTHFHGLAVSGRLQGPPQSCWKIAKTKVIPGSFWWHPSHMATLGTLKWVQIICERVIPPKKKKKTRCAWPGAPGTLQGSSAGSWALTRLFQPTSLHEIVVFRYYKIGRVWFLLVWNHSFVHEESKERCHGNIMSSWSDSTKKDSFELLPRSGRK